MNCLDCGVPMRPAGRTEAEFPGTVAHYGRGLCSPCSYLRLKAGTLGELALIHQPRAEAVEEVAEEAAAHTAWNTKGLGAYIRARRERGWPADGTLKKLKELE